jgi:NADH-quinone oxidoreductase subunit E
MSVRRLDPNQPKSFKFTAENARWAKQQIAKYPKGRQASAVIPLLWRAQRQNGGWVSEPAIRHVADMLDMAYIRVLEIATFYTMFNLSPVGEHLVQLCGTTPCWLRGADDLKATCRREIGEPGKISDDGKFTWVEVECLGACVNAPMVQINDDYYEDLDATSFADILSQLRDGKKPTAGPQTERQKSAPATGFTTLTDKALYKKHTANIGARSKR